MYYEEHAQCACYGLQTPPRALFILVTSSNVISIDQSNGECQLPFKMKQGNIVNVRGRAERRERSGEGISRDNSQ